MRVVNVLLFLMFTVFAYLNLNDTDALLWIFIYLGAGICCLLAAFHRFYRPLYLLAMLGCLLYAVFKVFTKDGLLDWMNKYGKADITGTMKASEPYIENTREFFGLMIVVSALLLNYYYAVYHGKKKQG